MITQIVIRQSEFDNDENWIVVDSLSKFAVPAGEAGFGTAELPPEVMWNSQVTLAFGQINRNGPSGYFYNVLAPVDGTSKWDLLIEATKSGLAALGEITQRAAYDGIIEAYIANRSAILAGRHSNSLYKLANDFELLRSFMPSSEAEEIFMALRTAWVRSLENLKVVPDQSYEQAVASALTQ